MQVKISNGQLMSLVIMTRMFTECMNFPADVAQYGMQGFTVVLIAKLLLLVMYIPLIIFINKYEGESFFTVLVAKCKPLAWISCVILVFHFVYHSCISMARTEFFLSNTIMVTADSWVLILLLSLVVFYGSIKGLQATARIGVIVLAAFIVTLILATFSLADRINFNYLYPAFIENPDILLTEILDEVFKNSEILVIAIVCQYLNKKGSRVIFSYVAVLFVLVEFLLFLTTTVLGPYLDMLTFPYNTLASLSDLIIFERLDGYDVAIWTVSAIIKTILYHICIRILLTALIKNKIAKIISSILPFVAGIITILSVEDGNSLLYGNHAAETWSILVIFGIIMPFVCIFLGKDLKKKGNDDVKKKEETTNNNSNPINS